MKSSQNWNLANIEDISSEKIQKNLRELSTFLNNDIRQMLIILRQYSPLELMKLACWEQHRLVQKGDDFSRRQDSAFIRFLQHAYCFKSTCPEGFVNRRDILPKDYRRLFELFSDMMRKSARYTDNWILGERNKYNLSDRGLVDQLQSDACEFWFPSLIEPSSVPLQVRALRLRMQPFNQVVSQTFTCGLDGLLEAFSHLVVNSKLAIDTLASDSASYKNDMQEQIRLAKEKGRVIEDEKAMINSIVEHQHWQARLASLIGRRDGYDLYNVGKSCSLDEEDCKLLSIPILSLEETRSLFPFEGRANANKPFLQVAGSFFCFDSEHLLDDFFPIVKAGVIAKGTISLEEWNKIEAESALMQPVSLVHSMLGPTSFTLDAKEHSALFDFPSRQVILKVLGKIEDEPFSDSDSYILALLDTNKILEWAGQQDKEVLVIDEQHSISYPLAISGNRLVLSYSQLANLFQDPEALLQIKEILGLTKEMPKEQSGEKEPARVQEPPLQEEQTVAKEILEQDGLIKKEEPKPYSLASMLSDIANGGQTEPVQQPSPEFDWPATQARKEEQPDLFQAAAETPYEEPVAKTPAQELPELEDLVTSSPSLVALEGKSLPLQFEAILEKLNVTKGAFFDLCKKGDEKLLNASSALIDKALLAQQSDGKEKLFTITQFGLTVILSTGRDDQLSQFDWKANIGAIMYAENKESWTGLILSYAVDKTLKNAYESLIDKKDYSSADWKYCIGLGNRLLERRRGKEHD